MHPCRVTTAIAVASIAVGGFVAFSGAAHGQVATNGLNIIVADDTLLPGESTTIRLEAYFGGTDYAVSGVATWLHSSRGAEGLSDVRLLAPMHGPGTSPGFLGETGVRGILAGQLNFHSIFADPTNPMPFWEATYTAPLGTTDPFDVRLETRTSRYDVYIARDSSTSESRLHDFADGLATIHVIPAPASALALGGLLLAPRRRRLAAVAMFACAASAAIAQTSVGGVIDTDTTWSPTGGPYLVRETIQITGDATLTILPDTEVRFDAGTGMVVGPGGPGGTGTLHAVGADRARVFFNGGTGLVFGVNAVPAAFDPSTGVFVGGSTLQSALIGSTQPTTGIGGAYAMRTADALPYLDEVTFASLASGSGAVYADLGPSLTASVRWGEVFLSNYMGRGLNIRGGREHVIESFIADNVTKVDGSSRLIEGFVRVLPEGAWDLEIRGGVVRSCNANELISLDRSMRLRFAGMTFEGCPGTCMVGFYAGLAVIDCRFEGNGINIHAGATNALVRDCEFRNTTRARGVDVAGSGTKVVEDCVFEGNAGPALISDYQRLVVRRCRFVGNTAIDGPGAIIAGSSTDLIDNHFERNSGRTGGAVSAGGAFTRGNTYIGNTAESGGAIAAGRVSYIGTPESPEVFIGNTATREGGAIYVNGSGVDIVGARFERNSATLGGAIAVAPAATGLAISGPGRRGVIMRGNTATVGADLYVLAPAGSGDILAPCVDWGTRDAAAIAERIHDGGDHPPLATVRFEPIGPCGCRVDLDGDGALTIFDFLAFQTAFEAGDVFVADFDGDGALTLFDFLAFQTGFAAGCP